MLSEISIYVFFAVEYSFQGKCRNPLQSLSLAIKAINT